MYSITSRAFSGVSLDLLVVLSTPSTGEPLNSFFERGTHGARSHKKSELVMMILLLTTAMSIFFNMVTR